MDWLVHKHHEAELKKIRPVSYCYNNSFTFPSSHEIPSHSSNSSNININVKPDIFFQNVPSSSPVSIHNKWFICLHFRYQLMYSAYYNWVTTFLYRKPTRKKWQLNSLKILSLTSINFRLLHKHSWGINLNLSLMIWHVLPLSSMIVINKLLKIKKITNQLINNNSNLLITRADNITVVLDKDYYFNKIRSIASGH